MPRFHFHIRADELICDPDGEDLPSLRLAVAEARNIARDLIADGFRRGIDRRDWFVEVRDGENHVLFAIRFGACLPPADTAHAMTVFGFPGVLH